MFKLQRNLLFILGTAWKFLSFLFSKEIDKLYSKYLAESYAVDERIFLTDDNGAYDIGSPSKTGSDRTIDTDFMLRKSVQACLDRVRIGLFYLMLSIFCPFKLQYDWFVRQNGPVIDITVNITAFFDEQNYRQLFIS